MIDNLTRITGIGPEIAEKLNKDGIHTFEAIAAAEAEHLAKLALRSGEADAWISGAKVLAAEKTEAEFKRLSQAVEAQISADEEAERVVAGASSVDRVDGLELELLEMAVVCGSVEIGPQDRKLATALMLAGMVTVAVSEGDDAWCIAATSTGMQRIGNPPVA